MARGSPVVRRWRVCVNGDEDYVRRVCADLRNKEVGEANLRFLVFQLERGAETNRLHIQAYVEFSVAKRASGVKTFFGGQADTRTCSATRDQNVAYATKEETRDEGPWLIGQGPTQGKRSDLQEIKTLVDEGAVELAIWEEHFDTMARNYQAIRQYRLAREAYKELDEDEEPPTVLVYWGATGTGKTRRAYRECKERGHRPFVVDVPDHGASTKWFDAYDGSSAIIIDDYGGEYGINFFKRLLDRYPMQLPVKGGYVNRGAKLIIITSNQDPENWYPAVGAIDRAAIRRRFTSVVHFDGL